MHTTHVLGDISSHSRCGGPRRQLGRPDTTAASGWRQRRWAHPIRLLRRGRARTKRGAFAHGLLPAIRNAVIFSSGQALKICMTMA